MAREHEDDEELASLAGGICTIVDENRVRFAFFANPVFKQLRYYSGTYDMRRAAVGLPAEIMATAMGLVSALKMVNRAPGAS